MAIIIWKAVMKNWVPKAYQQISLDFWIHLSRLRSPPPAGMQNFLWMHAICEAAWSWNCRHCANHYMNPFPTTEEWYILGQRVEQCYLLPRVEHVYNRNRTFVLASWLTYLPPPFGPKTEYYYGFRFFGNDSWLEIYYKPVASSPTVLFCDLRAGVK